MRGFSGVLLCEMVMLSTVKVDNETSLMHSLRIIKYSCIFVFSKSNFKELFKSLMNMLSFSFSVQISRLVLKVSFCKFIFYYFLKNHEQAKISLLNYLLSRGQRNKQRINTHSNDDILHV